VEFFEQFDDVMMEIRTKSADIKPILDLWFVPKNTEFAFSLNPQELIEKHEKWTSNLDERISAINSLLDKWFNVWLRFLPLLPVKNYKKIYWDFVEELKWKIDFSKISSVFVSGLLYTKSDYANILKKYPNLDILYRLEEEDWIFIRESREMRDFFYDLFWKLDKDCFICLDEK
jgi:spore photoproduct lyase